MNETVTEETELGARIGSRWKRQIGKRKVEVEVEIEVEDRT